MNIFIMFVVAILMAGFYMISAPSNRVQYTETEYAVNAADMRGVAECTSAAHNAAMRGYEFNDICVGQNGIVTQKICLNASLNVAQCDGVKSRAPAFAFLVTATAPIDSENYNQMMEIMERDYVDAGTFGLMNSGNIMTGGAGVRVVPRGIVSTMKLVDGQLVYITQSATKTADTEYATPDIPTVDCPAGTTQTYRFGRWQCVGYNAKTDCSGDTVWDSDTGECIPDESRKPLCAAQQTAVMVDDTWECVDPFPDRVCPAGMTLRLNYSTLEWECIADPTTITEAKKCQHFISSDDWGAVGTTLRLPQTSCTDCEVMVTDTDTCTSYCVPDASRVGDARCYGGNASECSGPHRAFYFGFPNASYAARVGDISGYNVSIDRSHSQNRRFNCLDCGSGNIDVSRSKPPYIAVCE